MLNVNSKYGNIHVNDMSIDIEKTNINELNGYLKELEIKRMEIIKKQNDYLSKIIG